MKRNFSVIVAAGLAFAALSRVEVPADVYNGDDETGLAGDGIQRSVWLKGGSLVAGILIGIDSKSIILRDAVAEVRLPRAAIAVIDMVGGTVERGVLKGRPPGCLLQNGDFVGAKLDGISKEGELIMVSNFFGRHEIPLNQVCAVKFADIKKKEPKGFMIETRSGSLILADSIISKGVQLIVRDNSRYFLNIHAGEVIDIRNARRHPQK